MKKGIIYRLGIFYQTKILGHKMKDGKLIIDPPTFTFTDARYFRDSFEKILKKSEVIEKDRKDIVESKKTEAVKQKELEKLYDEVVPGIKLDKNLCTKLEKAGVKLTIEELDLFE